MYYIGKFLWNPSATSLRHSWDTHYAALLEYGRQHGHYNVPHMLTYECTFMRTADDGAIISTPYKGNLGYWLSSQRQYKKNNSETLESNTDVNKSNCQSTTVSKHRLALLQALVNEGKLLWDETAYLTSNGHNNDEYMEPA